MTSTPLAALAIASLLSSMAPAVRALGPTGPAVSGAEAAPASDPPDLVPDAGFEKAEGALAAGWVPYESGYAIDGGVRRSGSRSARASNAGPDGRSGAFVTVRLDQEHPAPLLVTGWSRSEGVSGFSNNDYSIYVDLEFMDGTPLWGQTAPFSTGTHDWERRQVLVVPPKPLRLARIHALFRHHVGTAWFDDFSAVALPPDRVFDGQLLRAPALRPGARSGWFVRDVAAGSDPVPLEPGDGGKPGDAEKVLRVRLRGLSQESGGAVLTASIEDASGSDRAVTVYRVERFDGADPMWWNDIASAVPAPAGERSNLTRINVGSTGLQSLYPFGCVTSGRGAAEASGGAAGLLVGVAPLKGPWVSRIGFHASSRLLYVAFDVALTSACVAWSDGAGHGRADLTAVRSEVDAAGGFRDAAGRYYELFPEAFDRRATAEGIWIPFTDPSRVEGVGDFGIAYHEGDGSIATDDALGILSFRYVEPMTWWMPMPKGIPRTYEAALGMIEKHLAGSDEGNRRWAQAVMLSGTHDAAGRLNVEFQDAPWTDGAVWVLNPSPRLPRPPDGWTKARLSYSPEMAEERYGPGAKGNQDGEYLDSIEGWADVLDFRRESLAHSAAPPTFTTTDRRPVIPTWFSVFAFASDMRDDLRRRGKLLMANSTPWRIHAFLPLLDVAGTETNWIRGGAYSPDSDEVFCLRRTLCYRKPYLLLQNTDFDRFGPPEVERYFRASMAFAVYPSFFSIDASTHPYWTEPRWYSRDRHLFVKYIPAIRKLSAAGWEPVPRASSDSPAVAIERYGERYLTVRNRSAEAARATVRARLGGGAGTDGGALVVRDLVSGEVIPSARQGDGVSFEVSLDPGDARAVEIASPAAATRTGGARPE